jgi:putative RNA 2'-phosphotransferase
LLRKVLGTRAKTDGKNSRLPPEGQVQPMTKPAHQTDKLSKFLAYILGHRPDEFGIVPDSDGFVRVKELLQALHEEPGWRHIRQAHLNEALLVPEKPVIEIDGTRIRAVDASRLPVVGLPGELPKLLYIAIRPRAYPAALDRGLSSPSGRHLTLSKDEAMALRIGRRLDNHPTLLTVQVSESVKNGTCLQKYGRILFLADRIHPGTFSGPPLPKTKPDATTSSGMAAPQLNKTPGSYFPELEPAQPARQQPSSASRRREPQWKKDRRQARRHKNKLSKSNDA